MTEQIRKEWLATENMIYNLVPSKTGWINGERAKQNQYMIHFSHQQGAGGTDAELSEIMEKVLGLLRALEGFE